MISEQAFFDTVTRYQLVRRLGAGGMGVVYQVLDLERNEVVALKTMREYDASALYRFKREFRTLSDVVHPNLVKLHELASHEGHWFFTMEFVDGVSFLEFVVDRVLSDGPDSPDAGNETRSDQSSAQTVAHGTAAYRVTLPVRVRRRSAPALDRLRPALAQLVEAVQALHDRGHLHRDVKPSNVLVAHDGRVVLLDFGLVTAVDQSGQRRTLGGLMIGTPAYMAPEQAFGGDVTPASDWYSVGAVVYEALTGAYPFQAEPGEENDPLTLLERRRSQDPPPPSAMAADVPEDLDTFCRNVLRARPDQRWSGEAIRTHLGLAAADAPGRPSARAAAPFVGRESQLSALHAAFGVVADGGTAVVHVQGPSGMGKTSLLRRFLDDPRIQNNSVIIEGRCNQQESLPHKALDSVVDALSHVLVSMDPARVAPVLPADVSELARMFPVLERIEAIANAPRAVRGPIDPQARRQRAFQAFRELLARLTRLTPLVMYVDDLQWGDLDSALVIDELFRPPDPPAIMFIGSFRAEDAETSLFLQRHVRSMREQEDALHFTSLDVGPLTTEESVRLADALVGAQDGAAAAEIGANVVKEAGGHPYFLLALAQHFRDPPTATGDPSPSSHVTLSGVLRRRLQRLPDDARVLIEVLAVAGHPIEQKVAIEAAEAGQGAFQTIERLRSEGLLRTRSVGERVLVESFHDQIREAAMRSLGEARRVDLHRRVALALETAGHSDPEQLAHHFESAGVLDKAAIYCEAAADNASNVLAFDWAAELYSRAHRMYQDQPAARRRLTLKAAEAFANGGRGRDSATFFVMAANDATSTERIDLQRRAAEQLLGSGHIDEGVALIREVLQAVGVAYPKTPRHALAALVARRGLVRLRGVRFTTRADDDVSAMTRARLDVCRIAAEGLAMVDNIRGAYFQSRHLLMALNAGEPTRISLALALEAGFVATAGRSGHARAVTLSNTAMALARDTGDPHALGRATFSRGLAHYLVGEWRSAATECARAIGILRDQCIGVTWDLTSALRFEIGALHYLGSIKDIAQRVPMLLEDARRRGDLYLATELYSRDSHLTWLAADLPDTALRNIQSAMSRWSHDQFHLQHYNAVLATANCLLYAGRTADAWQAVIEMWPQLEHSQLMRVQVLRAEVRYLRARCAIRAAVEGDTARLEEARTAVAKLEGEHMPWCHGLALAVKSGLASARGDQAGTVESLRAAVDAFGRADMAFHAACARWQLGRIVEGDEGRAATAESQAWMRSQDVQQPQMLANVFVPLAGVAS